MVLSQLSLSPHWFYGLDAGFELFSLIVASIIAYYGHKIYRVSSEVKYAHFSFSFLFLALALLVRGVLDLSIFEFIRIHGVQQFLSIIASGNSPLHNTGTDIYRLLSLAAYALLIKAMYNVEDWKKSFLLVITVFAGILGSKLIVFSLYNIVSLILLAIIAKFFYDNYSKKKSHNAKLTLLAFVLLAASELFFILILLNPQFYVMAHLAKMAGFVVLAYNLYLVFKK